METGFNLNEAPLTRREGCPPSAQDAYFHLINRPSVMNPLVARLSTPALQNLLKNESSLRSNADNYMSCRNNFTRRTDQGVSDVPVIAPIAPTLTNGERTRERITERQIFSTEGRWGSENGPPLPSQEVLVGVDTRRASKEQWKRTHGSTTSAKRGLSTITSQVASRVASTGEKTFGELLFAERLRLTH